MKAWRRAVRVEIPGKIASHLTDRADLGEAERHALRRGRAVRRGQGYSLHVTALSEVHQALLAAAARSTPTARPPPTARRTGSTQTD